MRATYFLLFLILFSCNEKTEIIKIDSAVLKWFEEAREHSINLVYDISVIEEKKTIYIGTVIAEHPFINDVTCREDTILNYSNLNQYLKESDIDFLQAQLSMKPYHWKQEEFQYKKIVGIEILKLHNKESGFERNELDTTLWYAIKAEFNTEDIHIVFRPIFTKDFQYAIITINHYSYFQGISWFNGCTTLFCKNEDGYWEVIDYLNLAVS